MNKISSHRQVDSNPGKPGQTATNFIWMIPNSKKAVSSSHSL